MNARPIGRIVLADANILIPRTLRDYFVYAAHAGAIDVHWSQSILDEVSRNLIAKFGFTPKDADELELRLTEFLPRALVQATRKHLDLAAQSGADPGDVHVVAAALAARADVLTTQNIKHFPAPWLAERGIDLLTAGALLERITDTNPDQLREAHRITVANSPKTEDEILVTLERMVGRRATTAVRSVVKRNL